MMNLIFSTLAELKAEGTTILLVEQNANQALARPHLAFVLETGSITHSGTGRELMSNPAIKEAYLGVG
jgi:branched-chain amino acid transport system ATP-binding protein